MIDAQPLFHTIPYEDYERLKAKLDATQKECIRIAELYRKDKDLCHKEIEKIMARIDTDPDYPKAINDISAINQELRNENAEIKKQNAWLQESLTLRDNCIKSLTEKNATLEKKLWDLQRSPYIDNSAVTDRLKQIIHNLEEKLKIYEH